MGMGVLIVTYLIAFVLGIPMLIAEWKIFVKAGKPGWAVIIPIYSTIVMLEIIKRPIWWFLLLLVPGVNIVIMIIMYMELAECFGKSKVWGFFMLIVLSFIGFLILGFGKDSYTAPTRSARDRISLTMKKARDAMHRRAFFVSAAPSAPSPAPRRFFFDTWSN
jgi:hypothetical protein